MTVHRETPFILSAFATFGWFDRVTELGLYGSRVNDDVLPEIRQMKRLDRLVLGPTTNFSQQGLQQLRSTVPRGRIEVVRDGAQKPLLASLFSILTSAASQRVDSDWNAPH